MHNTAEILIVNKLVGYSDMEEEEKKLLITVHISSRDIVSL